MKIVFGNFLTAQKIWALFTSSERKNSAILLGLMVIGMALETMGIGLVIPAIAFMTQQESLVASYPALQPILKTFGNPSQQALIIGGMLTLVSVYFIKALFLAFLAWWQTRFAFGVQAQLSQRLFMTYLRQPYTFHLQRNSAQLIRNVINEVGIFTSNI